MRRVVVPALMVALFGLGLFAVEAKDAVTLEGHFVWERSDGERKGDLKAVFTPTGDDTWDVAFHFDWEDGPHVYAGTAEGSLSEGSLKGEVQNDDEERKNTFRFEGTFDDEGTFTGTHGHVDKDGGLNDTGTLTLDRSS